MIYLDHTATTRPYDEVIQLFAEGLGARFINPAGHYRAAIEEEKALQSAKARLASLLGCKASELIFTSGATESINTALKGYCDANRRKGDRVIIGAGDHPATKEAAAWLKDHGYDVVVAPLTADGRTDWQSVAELFDSKLLMVSTLSVNNETGAINDIASLRALRDDLAPGAAIHVDHVQGWNRLDIDLHASGVDLASFSGHKIHGPKGIGLLYCRDSVRFTPLIAGGGQQGGRRSGTESPLAADALALAATIGHGKREASNARVGELRARFLSRLTEAGIEYTEHAAGAAIPHILSIGFAGCRAETLVHMLEDQGILVSTRSACSSKKNDISPVLAAMKVPVDVAGGTIRVSFDPSNTEDEMDQATAVLVNAVKQLQLLVRPKKGRRHV